MKKIILLIIFSFLFLLFIIDNHLFYYGKNYINYNNRLPCNIKTKYWGVNEFNYEFGFLDEYGFSLLHKDAIIDSLKISYVNKYRFNDDSIFVVITDYEDKKHEIICSKKINPRFENHIQFSSKFFNDSLTYCNWIYIYNNRNINLLNNFKIVTFFIIILLLLFEMILILKKRK